MILVQFDAETGEQDIEFTKWVESLTQEELQVEVLKLYEECKALSGNTRLIYEETLTDDSQGKDTGYLYKYKE